MKKRNIVIRYFMLLVLIATLNDDFLKSFQITVETYKGIVQLTGFVVSQKAIDKAGEISSGIKGVKSVKNNRIVK